MGVNCVGKLCKNPIHFVCIFIVRRFFWPKISKINGALSKLFMDMKTHFSSISSYRDLSISDFLKSASLICTSYVRRIQKGLDLLLPRVEKFLKCCQILNVVFCQRSLVGNTWCEFEISQHMDEIFAECKKPFETGTQLY